MADIGNAEPTTLTATARDVYEEGALIFPCVKVQQDYRDSTTSIRMCAARIRVPEDWYGDYLGMLGAARIGERELQRLGEEVGWDAFELRRTIGSTTARSGSCARSARLPAGQHTGRDRHDPLPLQPRGRR